MVGRIASEVKKGGQLESWKKMNKACSKMNRKRTVSTCLIPCLSRLQLEQSSARRRAAVGGQRGKTCFDSRCRELLRYVEVCGSSRCDESTAIGLVIVSQIEERSWGC